MTTIAELEAALQIRWDRETLVVYADALEAAGDPRGALIAIDLEIEARGTRPELVATREELQRTWLGEQHYLSEYGLLSAVISGAVIAGANCDPVTPLVTSGLGAYLRHLHIHGTASHVADALDRLAALAMPWLQRLWIQQSDTGPVPTQILHRFVAATPNVRELHLDGEVVMRTPGHPNASRVTLLGSHALVVGAAPMPNATHLDLRLDYASAKELQQLAALVNPRTYPALKQLSLARNEYAYPTTLDRNVGMLPFVAAIEELDRLEWLQLPSLRTAAQVDELDAILERHPTLTVSIARMYETFTHPRINFPTPQPWPPRDQVSSREALSVLIPERPTSRTSSRSAA